jgi:hypothetical protein
MHPRKPAIFLLNIDKISSERSRDRDMQILQASIFMLHCTKVIQLQNNASLVDAFQTQGFSSICALWLTLGRH